VLNQALCHEDVCGSGSMAPRILNRGTTCFPKLIVRCQVVMANSRVHDLTWKVDNYLAGQEIPSSFHGTRMLIAGVIKARHWIVILSKMKPAYLHNTLIFSAHFYYVYKVVSSHDVFRIKFCSHFSFPICSIHMLVISS
jgi:hypothetical protein